ncbi:MULTISPECIES: cell wall hydrolase [unclassified Mesobacillus]|nr:MULTISPECIES: cell wall hydrolase [unclassified Mesobacillus]MCM3125077.1 cell wall hydrolase [Mesobacillus sp. MER 33]MCM3235163.1 cell wall hydrolase [Mesobacillus sp. MER 48]
MKKTLAALTAAVSLSVFSMGAAAEAATYQVKTGDTLWGIASKNAVPVNQLKKANNRTSNLLYPGQKLTIPASTVSAADQDLLARLVHAEAKGEPYAGKVAVATVVLNRVASSEFPNTIKGVIYQKSNGYYAFTPVKNGAINKAADAESKKAVKEAIAFRGQGNGSLFFFNPKTAVSKWVFSREATVTIGNHRFAK